jgi:hypothetical protein
MYASWISSLLEQRVPAKCAGSADDIYKTDAGWSSEYSPADGSNVVAENRTSAHPAVSSGASYKTKGSKAGKLFS